MSNYATKEEIEYATGNDTFDLATKKDFIALIAEVDKLDINILTNVLTSLNNLSRWFRCCKLRTVPVDLKISNQVIDNEAVKNTKFNTLKTKLNKSEKKIPDATTLIIHLNQ